MSTKTIEEFFTGKNLVIPAYQRDYAWTTSNIDDLFEDIEEAMELGGGHYMGTFILSQSERSAPVNVVDGQQRLTTLTMLLDALVDAVEEPSIKDFYRAAYITHPVHGAKFTVLGSNQEFFRQLLNDEQPEPDSDGQMRMLKAYQWICQRVQAIRREKGQEVVKQWLASISKLEVLEFTEPNEGKAIRMFQSVNDRGVPLAKMDIAKSLLIYYSNRFLEGELDAVIANKFGEAFRCFSKIKKLASEPGYQIKHINRDPFKEDDVLRYHYFAFDGAKHDVNAGADYNATSETVLESFLKPSLKKMRSDKERLSAFISAYVEDMASFFKGLLTLVEKTRLDKELYLLLVVQDLAATLYPLTIRLLVSDMLDERVASYGDRTLLELVEIADLRVYKLQGTNPQAHIAALMRDFSRSTPDQIASSLMAFCQIFMSSIRFESRLSEDDIFQNAGLVRILIEAENQARLDSGGTEYEITELAELFAASITVEHILPQEPSFGVRTYGFHSNESYVENIHRLGNLTLLERKLNSACNNTTVENKMREERLYRASQFQLIRELAAANATASPAFSRDAINTRGAQMARFAVRTWPISSADIAG